MRAYPRSASSNPPDCYLHDVIGYASMMAENKDIDWPVDNPFLLGGVDMAYWSTVSVPSSVTNRPQSSLRSRT